MHITSSSLWWLASSRLTRQHVRSQHPIWITHAKNESLLLAMGFSRQNGSSSRVEPYESNRLGGQGSSRRTRPYQRLQINTNGRSGEYSLTVHTLVLAFYHFGLTILSKKNSPLLASQLQGPPQIEFPVFSIFHCPIANFPCVNFSDLRMCPVQTDLVDTYSSSDSFLDIFASNIAIALIE